MLHYRPIDLEKDREPLLETHCEIIYSSATPSERKRPYTEYREEWMGTTQPDSYIRRLRETMKDVRNFAEFLEDYQGRLAGYLWIMFEDIEGYSTTVAYVMDLGVTAEFRRQGIAMEMLEHIEEEVRSRGATILRSDTGIENEASQNLHQKFGFKRYHMLYEKDLGDKWGEWPMVEQLSQHNIILQRGNVVLRPMTEDDWGVLHKWNSDPEVLRYADGNADRYSLEQIKRIYRGVCEHAFCFIIEHEGIPIGETYLQKMNLERLSVKFPDKDIRRIDIMIGEKKFWGQGIGTMSVGMLVDFGFEEENVDAIFACDVDESNVRSFKMFQKLGFEVLSDTKSAPREGSTGCDMILAHDRYQESQ